MLINYSTVNVCFILFLFFFRLIWHLHSVLSSASSSGTCATAMSPFSASINRLVCLPLLWQLHPQRPSPNIPIIFPTCPNHLSLDFLVFSPNRPTCVVRLIYSFLILSILVIPNENRNIFNCGTFISASCLFVSATIAGPPATIAGRHSPFTLAGTRQSQIAHGILLQPLYPACIAILKLVFNDIEL